MHDELTLSYLAGLLDGEGTITANNRVSPSTGNPGLHYRVTLSNSYQPIVLWLAETFGGKVYRARSLSSKHKPLLTWYLGGRSAAELCEAVLPYLRIKQRQAEIVVALSKLRYHYPKGQPKGVSGRTIAPEVAAARVPLMAEIVELNRRGVA